jgi:coniferyl-aldehyde dehydrogenase
MGAPALAIDSSSEIPDAPATVRHLRDLLARQRRAFVSDGAPSYQLRVQRLGRLIESILEHEAQIIAALSSDFGHRSRDASRLDVAFTVASLRYSQQNLGWWMKPEPRALPSPGAEAEVRYQPLGVVGIIAPWNFPVILAFLPLAQALAAGNRALIKPSELAPATARVIADIVQSAFDELEVAVINGGPEVGAAFTRLPLDHLLYTGSGAVAKQVMRAAAENLVPVTLELGGKSPVIVGESANLEDVAIKVMAAKCLNAGQICMAPDYVFVPEQRRAELVRALEAAVAKLFDGLRDNPDYTSILNERHFQRLHAYLDDARRKGAELVELNPKGESFEGQATHKLPPTLVLDPTEDMAVLQEEIFGPLLPIKTYRAIDEVIDYVNAHDRPLALYYFGQDIEEQEHVLSRTTSGGVTVNDCMLHGTQDCLPFGGVGASGMGAYHGRDGFLTFSHARAVYVQSPRPSFSEMLRPPYGEQFQAVLSAMLQG